MTLEERWESDNVWDFIGKRNPKDNIEDKRASENNETEKMDRLMVSDKFKKAKERMIKEPLGQEVYDKVYEVIHDEEDTIAVMLFLKTEEHRATFLEAFNKYDIDCVGDMFNIVLDISDGTFENGEE